MKCLRTFATPDGESHLEELDLLMQASGPDEARLLMQATDQPYIRRTPARQVADWHTAPRKQYIVIMAGDVEVEVSDGTVRRFGPGTLVLVEDTTGKGHVTRSVSDVERLSLFIPID